MSAVKKYFSDIYKSLSTTLEGMAVTGKNAFTRPVTEFYPHQRWTIPDRYRGILHNKIEDCTGCLACARACPVNCIHIETSKRGAEDYATASDGTTIKLWTTRFDIDMSLCMECGLCVPPCPTECLTMTKQYELSTSSKKDLYLEFAVDAERAAAAAQRDAEKKAAEAAAKAEEATAEGARAGAAKPDGPAPAEGVEAAAPPPAEPPVAEKEGGAA